jgi:hypothetical protein
LLPKAGTAIGGYALDTGMATSYLTFGRGRTIGGVDNLAVTPCPIQADVLDPATTVSRSPPRARRCNWTGRPDRIFASGVAGSVLNILPLSRLTVNSATTRTFNGTILGRSQVL